MTRPVEERFWAKVQKDGPLPVGRPELGPCWLWTGGLTHHNGHEPGGYARFSIDPARRVSAVRFAWELDNGPFPAGFVLDHVCHSSDPTCPGRDCHHRRCVNPVHVEVVTQRENVLRIPRFGTETHCPNAHEYTPENTYMTPQGYRQCRVCKRDAMRRFNAAHPGRGKKVA